MHDLTLSSYKDVGMQEVRDLHKGNMVEELAKIKDRAIEETDEDLAEWMRVYSANKLKVPMYDGIKDVLNRLHEKANLVINTSAIKENCLPLLERDGILDLFSFIASRELSTSKIEKFKVIAERFSTQVEEMLFITDTIGDIREAYAAKVPTIAVTWGVHTAEEFSHEPADSILAIVNTTDELETLLLK
ncbi:MAG: hypothetical protein RJB39_745 [Candidatus Parcubacteria bacterium]|jgi:phosphoglycolate phosphatase